MPTTGAPVLVRPSAIPIVGVQSGRPVRGGGGGWMRPAEVANHLLGRGAVLVPWTSFATDIAAGSSAALRVKAEPTYACRRRQWTWAMSTGSSGGTCFGTFTDPSGTSIGWSAADMSVRTYSHIEDVTSPTNSETDLVPTWAVDAGATKAVHLVGWSCYELPPEELALDANEMGVAVPTLEPSAEISEGTSGYSLGAVAAAASTARERAARAGLFHFARGTTHQLTTTSGTYARVFANGDPILLDRFLYTGETTSTVKVRARMSSGAGTTGDIRFTMTSGAVLTLNVTSAMASTWLTGTLAVDAEALTGDIRGRRRTPGDKCVIEWRRLTGANTVNLESISILGRKS